jgi:SAM-dependent methyltransferase
MIDPQDPWSIIWQGGQPTAFGQHYKDEAQLQFWYDFFILVQRENSWARINDIGSGNLEMSRITRAYSSDFELYATDMADIRPNRLSWSKGIQFHRATFERTAFPNEFLDAVTGAYALEYALDFHRALSEQYRVLIPGGRAAFLLHHHDSYVAIEARLTLADETFVKDTNIFALARKCLQNKNPRHQRAMEKVIQQLQKTNRLLPRNTVGIVLDVLQKGDPRFLDYAEDMFNRKLWSQRDLLDRLARLPMTGESMKTLFVEAGFEVEYFSALEFSGSVRVWAISIKKPGRPETADTHGIKERQQSLSRPALTDWSQFVQRVREGG